MIYHGVRQTASRSIYRLGLALFDLENPGICLQRGDSWVFGPETDYERDGDVKDVVFPLRTDHRSRWRHNQSVLWRKRFLYCIGNREYRGLLAWLDQNTGEEDTEAQVHP